MFHILYAVRFDPFRLRTYFSLAHRHKMNILVGWNRWVLGGVNLLLSRSKFQDVSNEERSNNL